MVSSSLLRSVVRVAVPNVRITTGNNHGSMYLDRLLQTVGPEHGRRRGLGLDPEKIRHSFLQYLVAVLIYSVTPIHE